MKEITLDQLPKYTPWTARLLGFEAFSQKTRSSAEVLREYDQEKWSSVLRYLESTDTRSSDEILAAQGLNPDSECAFMRNDRYFVARAADIMSQYEELLAREIQPYLQDDLVELGCGIGDKLIYLSKLYDSINVWGGEYTASGLKSAKALAKGYGIDVEFTLFDYNDPDSMFFIKSGSLVYTSHSIEQIPELRSEFLDELIRKQPKYVIHFEPCYEDQDSQSLIGLMRKKYIELNDYNRNLIDLLNDYNRRGLIEIISHKKNVFSDTPFNPTSVVVWAPV